MTVPEISLGPTFRSLRLEYSIFSSWLLTVSSTTIFGAGFSFDGAPFSISCCKCPNLMTASDLPVKTIAAITPQTAAAIMKKLMLPFPLIDGLRFSGDFGGRGG